MNKKFVDTCFCKPCAAFSVWFLLVLLSQSRFKFMLNEQINKFSKWFHQKVIYHRMILSIYKTILHSRKKVELWPSNEIAQPVKVLSPPNLLSTWAIPSNIVWSGTIIRPASAPASRISWPTRRLWIAPWAAARRGLGAGHFRPTELSSRLVLLTSVRWLFQSPSQLMVCKPPSPHKYNKWILCSYALCLNQSDLSILQSSQSQVLRTSM